METRERKKNREPSAKIELQGYQAHKEVLYDEQYNTRAGVSSTDDELFTESQCDRDSKSLPRMPKDRLEIPETLGWNASKPCESQPPSTYVSASTERSGSRFGSADAQEIRKRPDPGVSVSEGEGVYAQLRLFQTARRTLPPTKPPRKRKNKPYQRAAYPGEKVQVDVKYVPSACAVDQWQYYVYCAKDECSRWTYRKMYAEHTHSSEDFLRSLVKKAPFPIREVQTDNGPEFTKALLAKDRENLTLFERLLAGIRHPLPPHPPGYA